MRRLNGSEANTAFLWFVTQLSWFLEEMLSGNEEKYIFLALVLKDENSYQIIPN